MTVEWVREELEEPAWWDYTLMTQLMEQFVALLKANDFQGGGTLYERDKGAEREASIILPFPHELADKRQTYFASAYTPSHARKMVSKEEAIILGAQGVFDDLLATRSIVPDTSHLKTWRTMLTERLAEHDESWEDIESITLTDEEIDEAFDADKYSICGIPFTAWTKQNVYFSHEYDGQESVMAVPRHPSSGWVIAYPD